MAVAVFSFTGAIAGTFANLILSSLFEKYDPDDSAPENAGYSIGAIVMISYLACGVFFILGGNEYQS